MRHNGETKMTDALLLNSTDKFHMISFKCSKIGRPPYPYLRFKCSKLPLACRLGLGLKTKLQRLTKNSNVNKGPWRINRGLLALMSFRHCKHTANL